MAKPITIVFSIVCVCMWAACTSAQNQTNCPSSCGGIDIPYPFGVGERCYKETGFEIICNNTNNSSTSTPFLGISKKEVLGISLLDASVKVRGLQTTKCSDKKSGEGQGTVSDTFFDLSQTPFTLSDQNKVVGIGCDIFASITDINSQKYTSGCVSLCPDNNPDISNQTCSGIGCCEASIPKGLKAFNVAVNSINVESQPSLPFNASNSALCSFAATMQRDRISRSGVMQKFTSVVLNWVIGTQICNKTVQNFACGKNTNCANSTTGPGYICHCSPGFQGNPYDLLNGCQDINECMLPVSVCVGICINTRGSYTCSCPQNQIGDGRRDGSGCKPSGQGHIVTNYVLIGTAVGMGLLGLSAVGFLLYKKLKKRNRILMKQQFFKRNGGLLLEQQASSGEENIDKTKIFRAKELERVTDNFNDSRILGRGGSGTVFKGMLSDGRIVAIKKSKVIDESQIGQFINELVILSHINHRHIVQLFGCCLETEVPLLAYEYVSNGTLSHHLHDKDCKSSLSWDDRLRIATEIAGALSSMHFSAKTPIFHRDIKTSNILLDENFKTKISDFGISRSVPYENTHLTTLVQGTFGYLDPEYFHSGHFTDKSDVYSFGIVLVELLTGEKPISSTRPEEEQNLAMLFISSIKGNRVFEILETRVQNEGSKEELLVVAKLAKRCLKLVGKKRPTMREVTVELERLRHVEEEQSIPRDQQDSKYWLYDSFSISRSGPESEDTNLL